MEAQLRKFFILYEFITSFKFLINISIWFFYEVKDSHKLQEASVVDPEVLFRIRIQLNMKQQVSKNVISLWVLDLVYCKTVVWNIKWQIVDRFFFMIEFKVVLFTISK